MGQKVTHTTWKTILPGRNLTVDCSVPKKLPRLCSVCWNHMFSHYCVLSAWLIPTSFSRLENWKMSSSEKQSFSLNHKLEEPLKTGQWQNPGPWIFARSTPLLETCSKAKEIPIIMWAGDPPPRGLKYRIVIKYNINPGESVHAWQLVVL